MVTLFSVPIYSLLPSPLQFSPFLFAAQLHILFFPYFVLSLLALPPHASISKGYIRRDSSISSRYAFQVFFLLAFDSTLHPLLLISTTILGYFITFLLWNQIPLAFLFNSVRPTTQPVPSTIPTSPFPHHSSFQSPSPCLSSLYLSVLSLRLSISVSISLSTYTPLLCCIKTCCTRYRYFLSC
jgi:hypothetical protein